MQDFFHQQYHETLQHTGFFIQTKNNPALFWRKTLFQSYRTQFREKCNIKKIENHLLYLWTLAVWDLFEYIILSNLPTKTIIYFTLPWTMFLKLTMWKFYICDPFD